MKSAKSIILASASPRRKEILSDLGVKYNVHPADIDEGKISASTPKTLVKKLAVSKAECVLADYKDSIVIGADTIVVYRGKVYGKPHDRQNAFDMISTLNGRWHTVYTGVCVVSNERKIAFKVRSRVKFNKLTEEQIYAYIDECEPYDKAGAYGIQDARIVEKYKGSYTNIVGFPKEKLAKVLKQVGVTNGNN